MVIYNGIFWILGQWRVLNMVTMNMERISRLRETILGSITLLHGNKMVHVVIQIDDGDSIYHSDSRMPMITSNTNLHFFQLYFGEPIFLYISDGQSALILTKSMSLPPTKLYLCSTELFRLPEICNVQILCIAFFEKSAYIAKLAKTMRFADISNITA